MLKVENIVVNSETNCHPALRELYAHVELRLYDAITECVRNGLRDFQKILQLSENVAEGGLGSSELVQETPATLAHKPLISVSLLMNSPPDISEAPRITEIHKSLSSVSKSLVASASAFARWQKHSCIPCEPVKSEDDDDDDDMKVCSQSIVFEDPVSFFLSCTRFMTTFKKTL